MKILSTIIIDITSIIINYTYNFLLIYTVIINVNIILMVIIIHVIMWVGRCVTKIKTPKNLITFQT